MSNGVQSIRDQTTLPCRKAWKIEWFTWYSRRYLARHFHAFRMIRGGLVQVPRESHLVIYLNHASWWDPLACLVLAMQMFPHRPAFAPMDALQLKRYRIFENLGFFGVEQQSARGAVSFLRASLRILEEGHVLWITPQGRFCDPRERPVQLASGLAHLALRSPDTLFLPLAIEYPFWHDRLPEITVRWGQPVRFSKENLSDQKRSAALRTVEERLASALEQTQDALSHDVQTQNAALFETVLSGAAGVGGVYDVWRRMVAKLRGATFQADHDLPLPESAQSVSKLPGSQVEEIKTRPSS